MLRTGAALEIDGYSADGLFATPQDRSDPTAGAEMTPGNLGHRQVQPPQANDQPRGEQLRLSIAPIAVAGMNDGRAQRAQPS